MKPPRFISLFFDLLLAIPTLFHSPKAACSYWERASFLRAHALPETASVARR